MKRMVYPLLGLGLASALCVWWETAVFSRTVWQSDGSRVEYRENARGDVLHEARYDETGRWESAVDYRYDALGRVTRVDRHPSGVYERYTYGDGTATVEQFRLSGESMQTQSLTLDSHGRTTRSKTVFADGISSGETRFTYDAGMLSERRSYGADGTLTSRRTCFYDEDGAYLGCERQSGEKLRRYGENDRPLYD